MMKILEISMGLHVNYKYCKLLLISKSEIDNDKKYNLIQNLSRMEERRMKQSYFFRNLCANKRGLMFSEFRYKDRLQMY